MHVGYWLNLCWFATLNHFASVFYGKGQSSSWILYSAPPIYICSLGLETLFFSENLNFQDAFLTVYKFYSMNVEICIVLSLQFFPHLPYFISPAIPNSQIISSFYFRYYCPIHLISGYSEDTLKERSTCNSSDTMESELNVEE